MIKDGRVQKAVDGAFVCLGEGEVGMYREALSAFLMASRS